MNFDIYLFIIDNDAEIRTKWSHIIIERNGVNTV